MPEKLMLPLGPRHHPASLKVAKAIMPPAIFRYVLSALTSTVDIGHLLRAVRTVPMVSMFSSARLPRFCTSGFVPFCGQFRWSGKVSPVIRTFARGGN